MKQLLSILSLLVSISVFAQQTLDKSFDGVENLYINLASGDCTLKKGTDATIKVHLQYSFNDDNFKPKFEQSGSKLVIEEKLKGRHNSGFSKWTITIPDGLKLKLNTGSGDLLASNLVMELNMNSGSGDINISESDGDVTINTGSGDVDLENQKGGIKVNTGSGDVNFEGSGEVNINAGSGDINIRNSKADFSVNTGSGDIRASNVVIAGNSSFNTGSGDAEVELDESLDYNISVNSGSGDAILDFNNNEIRGIVTMKANKKNGRIEAPFDFDKVEEEESGSQVKVIKTVKIGSKDIEIKVGTGSGKAEIMK